MTEKYRPPGLAGNLGSQIGFCVSRWRPGKRLRITLYLCFSLWAAACDRRVEQQQHGALGTLALIHSAQYQYFEEYRRLGAALNVLGPPADGARSPDAAALIPDRLARSGERLGYKFTLLPTQDGFRISAIPVTFGVTGEWTFLSEASIDTLRTGFMRVHAHHGPEPATLNDPARQSAFRSSVEPDQVPRKRLFGPGSE